MANTETFKISAALKDLIGKELITDEFVAVFELVKNSFDANASKVEVIFEDTSAPTQNSVMDTESTAKPKFRLITSGGTKARDEQQFLGTNISWEGALRKDNITP